MRDQRTTREEVWFGDIAAVVLETHGSIGVVQEAGPAGSASARHRGTVRWESRLSTDPATGSPHRRR